MRKPDKGTLTFIFAKTWPIETSLRYSYDFRYGIANDKPPSGKLEGWKRLFYGCNATSAALIIGLATK